MSEAASIYYAYRGFMPLPALLEGAPETLVGRADLPSPAAFAADFTEKVEPLSEYVLQGVRQNIETHSDRTFSDAEWADLREKHPQYRAYAPLGKFAAQNVTPAVLPALPDFGTIRLEAIAPEAEYTEAFRRMAGSMSSYGAPHPFDIDQERSQAFLLTRTLSYYSECAAAHMTMVWGEVRRRPHRGRRYISVRYLGTALLPKEIAAMSWLHEPRTD